MAVQSAGILVYRLTKGGAEVLLGHPGGPFWAKKDEGAWSIPKGELDPQDDHLLAAAYREFEEEMGSPAPSGQTIELSPIKQSGGKTNHIWAVEGDFDATAIKSNTLELEWPPKSGKKLVIPELDRAAWFDLATAKRKLFKFQAPFIDQLAAHLNIELPPPPEQHTLF